MRRPATGQLRLPGTEDDHVTTTTKSIDAKKRVYGSVVVSRSNSVLPRTR